MKPVVRFAPDPTGRIHIGNSRPALLNWLFEQHDGGTFLLRFDDTDQERSRGEYAEGIREDGREPRAILSRSATVGASYSVAPYKSLNALASLFDFAKLSRVPARFDIDELKSANARLLQAAKASAALRTSISRIC